MTYEKALASLGDPYEQRFAWLRLTSMELGAARVLMVVKPEPILATAFSFNKNNCLEQIQRISIPYDLRWESIRELVGYYDKQRTDWHSGSLDDMKHFAKGLFS
jgi:hypothetical protein